MPRCLICNDYETSKSFNFKRHRERCLRRVSRSHSVSPDSSAEGAEHTERSGDVENENTLCAAGLAENLSSSRGRAARTVPLTRFDALSEPLHAPSDYDEDSELSGAEERPMRSTPRGRESAWKQPEPLPLSPVARRAKLRRHNAAPSSIMALSEREHLLTRIDELEALVMKLQHAVCVMDSRMQQFRMATSSWQPVMADELR